MAFRSFVGTILIFLWFGILSGTELGFQVKSISF